MEEQEKTVLKNTHSRKREARILIGIVAVILLLWGLLGGIVPRLVTGDLTKAGTLGDSFGMVNALFSGLAFIGVVVAIWLQTREYRQQLHEFEEQTKLMRSELELQTNATSAQIAATHEQIALLKSERESRELERELQASPIFMLRMKEQTEDRVELDLYNGGAPVFDVRVTGDDHAANFISRTSTNRLTRTNQAEILGGKEPLTIELVKSGLNGKNSGGSFLLESIRMDHKPQRFHMGWDTLAGLSKEKIPRTWIRPEEE